MWVSTACFSAHLLIFQSLLSPTINPLHHRLLGMVLYPLAQSQTVSRRADSGETLPRMPQPLPQVFKPLLEAINSKDVNDANEIALLWPVYYVNRVFVVRQQTPVLGLKLQHFSRVWSNLRGPLALFSKFCPRRLWIQFCVLDAWVFLRHHSWYRSRWACV